MRDDSYARYRNDIMPNGKHSYFATATEISLLAESEVPTFVYPETPGRVYARSCLDGKRWWEKDPMPPEQAKRLRKIYEDGVKQLTDMMSREPILDTCLERLQRIVKEGEGNAP